MGAVPDDQQWFHSFAYLSLFLLNILWLGILSIYQVALGIRVSGTYSNPIHTRRVWTKTEFRWWKHLDWDNKLLLKIMAFYFLMCVCQVAAMHGSFGSSGVKSLCVYAVQLCASKNSLVFTWLRFRTRFELRWECSRVGLKSKVEESNWINSPMVKMNPENQNWKKDIETKPRCQVRKRSIPVRQVGELSGKQEPQLEEKMQARQDHCNHIRGVVHFKPRSIHGEISLENLARINQGASVAVSHNPPHCWDCFQNILCNI